MTGRHERAAREAESLTVSLGVAFCEALAQAGVIEFWLNDDGRVWLERLGEGKAEIGQMDPDAAETFILAAAGRHRRTLGQDAAILECDLPPGEPFRRARFAATLPPVSVAPTFNLRMLAARVFTLADYVAAGIMSPRQRAAIEAATAARENILVTGGTGSGKTTLVNAILAHIARIAPDHRQVVIEEVPELQCDARDVAYLRTTIGLTPQDLVRHTLRRHPDRIIVGEVRGREALDMLKAWNTGHDGGVSTIHSNVGTARAALTRVEMLVAESGQAANPHLVAEAVNVIVSVEKDPTLGRRVREVVRVCGYRDGAYTLQPVETA